MESPKPEQNNPFFSFFYSLALTSLLGAPVLSHVLANSPSFFLFRGSPYLARYALSPDAEHGRMRTGKHI